MNRNEFLMRLGRFMLLFLIGIITFILGSKVVTGADCTTCPGSGICRGESDCTQFLEEKR